jgi:hypothetical protein
LTPRTIKWCGVVGSSAILSVKCSRPCGLVGRFRPSYAAVCDGFVTRLRK